MLEFHRKIKMEVMWARNDPIRVESRYFRRGAH